ncbi:MAG TPA: site-2 protease family protein, partial [Actinomycetales bacterium]|nr:site-2 protease family protein [Actinomycetales bacterium]
MRLGTYAGAPIIFTSSWLILGVLLIALFAPIARRNWPDLGPWSYGIAAIVVVFLGFSTLVHEMAHAIVAHRSRLRITAINVTFWGGATHLGTPSPTPRIRALISLAGPVSNLVLALISYGLWQVPERNSIPWALLAVLTFVNLFVGLLNLFPALPLDGGGIVEAIIWAIKKDQYVASRITGRISQILGALLALSPFVWMATTGQRIDFVLIVWAIILGATMWATGASLQNQRAPRPVGAEIFLPVAIIARHQTVDQLPTEIAALDDPAAPAPGDQHLIVIQEADGTVTGWVDPKGVAQVPMSLAATTPVTAVSRALPGDAILRGWPKTGQEWVSVIGGLTHEIAGFVILDDETAAHPGRPRAAVNMQRLV